MIIKIAVSAETESKHVRNFCGQLAGGDLLPSGCRGHPTRKFSKAMLARKNRDVPEPAKNELRELIMSAWKEWRATWPVPPGLDIKISFPDEIDDRWQRGTVYYLFPGACHPNRVLRF